MFDEFYTIFITGFGVGLITGSITNVIGYIIKWFKGLVNKTV
mgnify:CR=1 FL=1